MIRLGYDFDVQQLKTFLSVAQTLNFSKSALAIGRTQSAVSLQIKRLEEIVGRPLFVRSNRHVSLTEAGTLLLPYAKRILATTQELRSLFEEYEIQGEVRFGTPEDFASFYLPKVLAEFARAHPLAQLTVDCDLTLHLLRRFEQGAYDMILIKREPSGAKTGTTVWHEPLVWAAADALIAKEPVLPLVVAPQPCLYRKRAIEALDRAHRPWRISYTSPSFAGSLAAVRAGLGVTILPKHMISEDLVVVKPASGLPALPDAEIALLTRKPLSPTAKIFAEHIIKSIA